MVNLLPRRSEDSIDPLSRALSPPAKESTEQRVQREAKEIEARRVSERIDDQLKSEKQTSSRKKAPVRVLMLGQAESGKSTTIKVFQMSYARQAWEAQRASWRTVIHLNLVRSVNAILDALEYAPETASRMNLLRMRLSPLRRVQHDLEIHLGLAEGEEVHAAADGIYRRPAEVCVRSRTGWAAALRLAKQKTYCNGRRSLADEAFEVILMSRDDIAALWGDDAVRAALEVRDLRLEDQSGFFLDDLYRIAQRGYEPTDDDVVRARLRTMGVQEHRFLFETGQEAGREWIFYDVGGSPTHRGAWHPYFMDVKAIIFLAPISVFDERLEGDSGTNRLEDSMMFWTSICKSKLLVKVQLILFLNKCDILERKLARGVQLRRYISSYGDRRNDLSTASKYLQKQFLEISRRHSPEQRDVYCYLTTAIDTRAMSAILKLIRVSIISDNLQNAAFIQ